MNIFEWFLVFMILVKLFLILTDMWRDNTLSDGSEYEKDKTKKRNSFFWMITMISLFFLLINLIIRYMLKQFDLIF